MKKFCFNHTKRKRNAKLCTGVGGEVDDMLRVCSKEDDKVEEDVEEKKEEDEGENDEENAVDDVDNDGDGVEVEPHVVGPVP